MPHREPVEQHCPKHRGWGRGGDTHGISSSPNGPANQDVAQAAPKHHVQAVSGEEEAFCFCRFCVGHNTGHGRNVPNVPRDPAVPHWRRLIMGLHVRQLHASRILSGRVSGRHRAMDARHASWLGAPGSGHCCCWIREDVSASCLQAPGCACPQTRGSELLEQPPLASDDPCADLAWGLSSGSASVFKEGVLRPLQLRASSTNPGTSTSPGTSPCDFSSF